MRQAEGAFVAEGAKILEVALENGQGIESVFVAAGGRENSSVARLVGEAGTGGARIFDLAPGVMERVADTVTPQPVCGIVMAVDVPLARLLDPQGRRGAGRLVLVCADVRDPGNLGSVLRVAAASGTHGVIVCSGSVDPYNPKAVRASAGALFHVPLVKGVDPSTVVGVLREAGFRLVATSARGGADYLDTPLDGDLALVLGNEAAGLPEDLETSLESTVTIPMAEAAESLNVATAAAVICFEARRRRRSECST